VAVGLCDVSEGDIPLVGDAPASPIPASAAAAAAAACSMWTPCVFRSREYMHEYKRTQ
jgi:fructose-specific phosphotransferase system IIC component